MKERQRWRSEEDAVLISYVNQYGPRDWHLISQRMSVSLHRDPKSCLERWKNYLKPGIKKGSLTADEQRLVIALQANHGNKWKKIAAQVPGRTPKRLGKWWEVFNQQRNRCNNENSSSSEVIETSKYDRILESFAEKLVPAMLPPWLSTTTTTSMSTNPSPPPSVVLTLAGPPSAAAQWGPNERAWAEIGECCREVGDGYQAWAAHKKEAGWMLKRVELQMETRMASRKREKMEEIEAKIRRLKEEERAELERIEAEYREEISALRREAEAKEQKLAEQWAAKHARLRNFVEQLGGRGWMPAASAAEANGR